MSQPSALPVLKEEPSALDDDVVADEGERTSRSVDGEGMTISKDGSGITKCSAGTKGEEPASKQCLKCAAGTSSTEGMTSCLPCSKGKYAAKAGDTCSDCAVATYQPQNREPSNKCLDCPLGYGPIKDKEEKEIGGSSLCLDLNWNSPEDCTAEQYLDNRFINRPESWNCTTCPRKYRVIIF